MWVGCSKVWTNLDINFITYPTSQLPTRSRRDSARRRCRHSLSLCAHISIRGVARGGGAEPPEFGRSVTLFKPGGADYAPHTAASPPGFKKLSTSLTELLCF